MDTSPSGLDEAILPVPAEAFTSVWIQHQYMLALVPHGHALFLGPFTAPPVLIGTLIVLLLILFVGRVLIGLAWRLVLIALAVVVVLWILGALGTVLNLL